MGMSAWMLFAAPYVAPATAAQDAATLVDAAAPAAVVAQAPTSDDIFGGDAVLQESVLRDSTGTFAGSPIELTQIDAVIDVGNVGANTADNRGLVKDIAITDTTTGQIANNAVNDNNGITTVFNNTGNGVVFQSTVQVNIFLDGSE